MTAPDGYRGCMASDSLTDPLEAAPAPDTQTDADSAASTVVAPVLVLCGGLLLRYLCVYSDERAEIPGENRYYNRTADPHAEFVEHWTYGENMY